MTNTGPTVSDLIHVFLRDRFTAHGFPRCRSGTTMGSIYRRTTWFFIASAFTAYGSWQILGVTVNYFSNPTITSFEVKQPVTLQFPAVTICPSQAIRTVFPDIYRAILLMFKMPSETFNQVMLDWVKRVEDEQKRLRVFVSLENKVLQAFKAGRIVSVRDLFMVLEDGNFTDVDYFRRFQQIRRINSEIPPREGRPSIWEGENVGLIFDWFNRTWNQKYFDIRSFMSKNRPGYNSSSSRSMWYLDQLLTQSMESFRLSLRPAENESPDTKGLLEGRTKDIQQMVNTLTNGEMLYYGNRDDYIERYLLQRLSFPYMFTVDDVILSCMFQGRNCQTKFYSTIDPRWKGCFHFNNEFVHEGNEGMKINRLNSTQNRKTSQTVDAVGKEEGLTLKLITRKNSDGFSFLSPTNGYIIAIGDSATMPRLDQHIVIPNTGDTDLAIQRTEITRLTPDNGGFCANENHFETAFPDLKVIGLYDQNICRQLLVYSNILKECGCIMSSSVLGGILNIEDVISEHESCAFDTIPCTQYASERANNQSTSMCPPACREIKFDIFSSTVPYNENGAAVLSLLESLEAPIRTLCSVDGDDACRHPKFSTVNIFYRSNSVQMLQETLIYSPFDFVANIGGLAGLYIGISLVSLMEIVEFFFDLFIFRFRKNLKPLASTVGPHSSKHPKWGGDIPGKEEISMNLLERRFEQLERDNKQLDEKNGELAKRVKTQELKLETIMNEFNRLKNKLEG